MREAFEAVAEFLARHGGLDEYDAVRQTMQHRGWTLDQDHAAQWRALLAVLRSELSETAHEPNYTFIFERLLQLYVRIPVTMCREIFSSPLFLHILVERLAAAYEDFDAEVFRTERDVLCHAEDIYSTCTLVLNKLYNGSETSVLGRFLREFRDVFDGEDPKSAWEALYGRYRMAEIVFRRDMKRMLWSIEEEVFGPTQIEEAFGGDAKTTEKRVIVPRRILENKFMGSDAEWRDLADVVSVRGLSAEPPSEDRRESFGGVRPGQRISDVVGETPPAADQEERVWSARLPIATPGGDSDDSSEEADNAMDAVVRQEKPTQKSPGQAKKTQQANERSPAQTPERPRSRQPSQQRSPARRRAEQPEQRQAGQRANDEAVEEIDDDEFFDPANDVPVQRRKRKGRKFWTEAEVDALIKGLKRYGGQWKVIKDMYSEALRNRSNVDLKDKYRNLVKAKRIPPIQHDD